MKFSDSNTSYNPHALISPKKRQLLERLRSLKIPINELLSQYAAGERDFRGVNLSDQFLVGVDLSGADLSEARLHGAVLEAANLTRVNLMRTDLSGANLRGADLTRANLVKANLQGANLRGADLSGAEMTEANLTGADLGGAILPDGSIMLTSHPSSRAIFPCTRSSPMVP